MADAPLTPRAKARAQFTADLLAAGRAHLEKDGAATLSLRAIARDLGVASSAVYRYVDSRDGLLTLLVIEAYDSVGLVCEQAEDHARSQGAPAPEIWLDVARAFRNWALENRHSYELIYGTPIRGYAAPQDTVAHAARVWGVVVRVMDQARAEGDLLPTGAPFDADGLLAPDVRAAIADLLSGGEDEPFPEEDVARSLSLFTNLLGATTAELFGHFHGFSTDDARTFDAIVATGAAGVGLRIDLEAV